MRFLPIIIIVVYGGVTCCICDVVDYYIDLITNEIERAHTHPLPKNSYAHKPTYKGYAAFGTFDYIVVGAGSAGAVIANRLSEDANSDILLLEAGGYETEFNDIPSLNIYSMGLEFNWNYNSTPQTTACLGLYNKECGYPTGKGLGGTSIINALMYVRGNKRDYDNWFQQGNPGWAYKDVLPYFKKSENFVIDGDSGYHGKGGYLNVEYHKPDSPILDAFIEANLQLGRKAVDYNGKEQLGVSRTQLNTVKGRRHSTGRAFLYPAMSRKNLKISTRSLVVKTLIDDYNKRAYGVLFTRNGKLLFAEARKEIVLSAGTIGTPQLLMLSGVGPKRHLRDMEIPVVQDLSVGDNFQDHATYFSLMFSVNYTEPSKTLREKIRDYLDSYGSLTIPGNSQGLGFYRTKLSKISNYPDIEFVVVPANCFNNFISRVYHYNDDSFNTIWGKADPSRTFVIYVILLHPKSKGQIRLKSKDPFEYPSIDPRFLSDAGGEDIETMYQGVQLALELTNTDAFRALNATLMYAPLPACQHHRYLSREYWYCQLRQLTTHIFHPIGTCKMGPDPVTGAVVNHELKVHGINNLRVADASIIPEATSGHTNAAAIMIGEKAADLIKKQN